MNSGIYQHFKGNFYVVYGTAVHSETGETLVLYYSAGNPDKSWARPKDMFLEEGRFKYVGPL
jgi:cyclomaltodextrinase / maltogenic alpha-amylase / neopullulanase